MELETEYTNIIKKFEEYLKEIQMHQVTPALLKNIIVEIDNEKGKKQKSNIMQFATIDIKNNKTLLVQPKTSSHTNAIYKAISSSINANVSKINETIEIVYPPTTSEDRKKTEKIITESLNGYKMQIKNKRQDYLKEFKKLSKEEFNKIEKKAQEKTDKANEALDKLNKSKIQEISKV